MSAIQLAQNHTASRTSSLNTGGTQQCFHQLEQSITRPTAMPPISRDVICYVVVWCQVKSRKRGMQGNTAGRSSSLNTALAASSSARTSLDTPPSPVLEMSRGRARRSSMVSTSSITSETSLDQELDFGLTTSITMQVERMLHVRQKQPLNH